MREYAEKVNEEVDENWASFDTFRDEVKEFYGEQCFQAFCEYMDDVIKLRGVISEEERKIINKS